MTLRQYSGVYDIPALGE